MIQGEFESGNGNDHIVCALQAGKKKIFRRNGIEYERLADHIGLIPLVVIAPEDTGILSGGSDERRRFIDSVISQTDKIYLDNLINYFKALEQRNRLLKQFAINKKVDYDAIESWNRKLITPGEMIFRTRKVFLNSFIPLFNEFYSSLCNTETVDMEYYSQLNESALESLMTESIQKDLAVEYTTTGIHKDDLIFKIASHPVKRFGSQGQQKSFIIALKLAVHRFLYTNKNVAPILLLDDIFDKLDLSRINKLMTLLTGKSTNYMGQIVITDTHPERLTTILRSCSTNFRIYAVENGMVRKLKIEN